MPNYQKCANKLFTASSGIKPDQATGKMEVMTVNGQTFVKVKQNQQEQSLTKIGKAVQEIQAQQNTQNVQQPKQQETAPVPKLVKTRSKITIKKNVNTRAFDGIQTQNDETYKKSYKKAKFFEEIEDAPKIDRNKSSITHQFTIADGYQKDVWTTSHEAHAFIPEQYPAGYMTNQGIAAMYSTFSKTGRLGGCEYKRQFQGLK